MLFLTIIIFIIHFLFSVFMKISFNLFICLFKITCFLNIKILYALSLFFISTSSIADLLICFNNNACFILLFVFSFLQNFIKIKDNYFILS